MTFIQIPRQRRRMPERPIANLQSQLLTGATHLYAGPNRFNILTGKPLTVTNPAPPAFSNVEGPAKAATEDWGASTVSGQLNAAHPWTYACIAARVIDGTSGSIAICQDSRGSGTQDRSIDNGGSSQSYTWSGYFYSSGGKYVDSTIFATLFQPFRLVFSVGYGFATFWVNGQQTAQIVAATNGFTGYGASPILSFGLGDQFFATRLSASTVPLFLRVDGYAWGQGQVEEFVNNPWQLVADPLPRRLYFLPTVNVAPRSLLVNQAVNRASTY